MLAPRLREHSVMCSVSSPSRGLRSPTPLRLCTGVLAPPVRPRCLLAGCFMCKACQVPRPGFSKMDYCFLKSWSLLPFRGAPVSFAAGEAGPLPAGGPPLHWAGAKVPGKGLQMGFYGGPGLKSKPRRWGGPPGRLLSP